MRIAPPIDADSRSRGQSEVIGIVLLTGVVVLTTAVVGFAIFANVSTQAQSAPLVDIGGNATTEYVTVEHRGGDSLDTADVAVAIAGDTSERYALSSFTQRVGTDSSRFEPGDKWRRPNTVGGDRLVVRVIDDASNTVLDMERFPVNVTIFARFSWSPEQPNQGETITFDASNSGVEGSSLTSYEWDFDDDGATDDATGQSPSTSFSDDGEYPVTLKVTAADGRTATTTKTVYVYNSFPSPSFTYTPSNPDPGETISFDASGSSDSDGSITSYAWDFDDDGNNEATGETATFTYGSAGDYTVRLKVTDDDGATNGESKVVSVASPSPPSVSITGTTITQNGNSYDIDVTFEATDSDNDVSNYTVILYDSSAKSTELDRVTGSSYDGASTTETVSASPPTGGGNPYCVVVRVGDSQSQVGTAEKEVDANNGAPTASFTYSPSNPSVDQTITFDASGSTDPEGDSLTYEWDWTDDGTVDTTTSDPDDDATHSYSSGGTYTVSLTVRDGNGGVDTTSQTVSVGSKDFTSVSASDVPKKSNGATQTFSFTVDEALADGETVTINLDDPQSVTQTGNSESPDPVDYRSATVDTGASSLDGGSASLSASTDTASITYTATGEVSAGTTISIEVDGVETGTLGGKDPDPQVTFTRSDGLQDSTTFTLT